MRRRDWLHVARQTVASEPLDAVSATVVLLVLLLSLSGEQIAGTSPTAIVTLHKFQSPSAAHWFGTDNLGRDVFARIASGGRSTLRIAFISVILASVCGMAIGIVAAYYRGWVATVLSRIVDSMLAVPALLLAMILVLALGQSDRAVIIAIVGIETPRVARVARAATIAVRSEPYVQAAQAMGAGDLRIMLRHLLPQTVNAMFVLASSILGSAIIIDASLSFLGVGRPQTEPSWGGMLAGTERTFLGTAWWIAVFSGLLIALVVLAFNLLGDPLRALLDPRGPTDGKDGRAV